MSTGTAAGHLPATRHGLRAAVLAAAALIMLIVVVVGGLAGWQSISAPSAPSAIAVADIPADYLSLYEQAGRPLRDRLGRPRGDRQDRVRSRTQPIGRLQSARDRERQGGDRPDAVHRLDLESRHAADDGPGHRAADDVDRTRVRHRRRRRRSRERLGSGRRDRRGRAPPARQRSAGRLPRRALRIQPVRRIRRRRPRAGDGVSRRLRSRRVGRRSARPRMGGLACRPLHLQPRPADRPRRLGAGHAQPRACRHDLRLLDVHTLGVRAGGHRHRPHDLDPVDGERSPAAGADSASRPSS